MAFFNKKPKPPAYVAPAGPITLDVGPFRTMMRTRPAFTRYAQIVGLQPASTALGDCFAINLLGMTGPTSWVFGSTANFGNPQSMTFADLQGLNGFIGAVEGLLDLDIAHISGRSIYANGLKGQAAAHLLLPQLQNAAEPEGSYYVAPPPVVQRIGVPPIPPKPADYVNMEKGLSWMVSGVQGNTVAFRQTLQRFRKFDGTNPLGANATLLTQAWQALVPIAPARRGWNPSAMMQKYPSNIGGMKVLNDILLDLSTTPLPVRGSNDWYDLALYVYGSVITAQAFTDGNKRAARLAYVLMLLTGGVPMIVPNGVLGATLGDM